MADLQSNMADVRKKLPELFASDNKEEGYIPFHLLPESQRMRMPARVKLEGDPIPPWSEDERIIRVEEFRRG